ncbi:MAG: GreA/GreB family elongation factor [Spirochaetales bacterium]|nr:GreA/GreB family elongation factor [Spirochaetales bacterium]
MVIRDSDYRLLSVMCRGYLGRGYRVGDGLRVLAARLGRAVVVPDEEFPGDVAALDSTMRLTELNSAVTFDCRIVLPSQVDLDKRHISVLSLVGATVIGERQGVSVVYRTPDALRLIRIDQVRQPQGPVNQTAGDLGPPPVCTGR